MRQAGHRPLQQLALTEHLFAGVLGALARLAGAALVGLPGPDQLDQPEDAASGDRHGHDQHQQGEGEAQAPRGTGSLVGRYSELLTRHVN